MKDDEAGDDAVQTESDLCPLFLSAALLVHGRVESQPQAAEDPQVPEQAGEGGGVDVDPLGPRAPALGFLQCPEKVHTQGFQYEVETQSEDEEGGVKVSFQVCLVDGWDMVESFNSSHPL
ncbi:hypothetical protein NDU88_002476 [Pleurodeles waltl]|uniref:Uncharacterized protein n=1 Tax=Pleurodeles waltl TaxID=8319 RepID=A0AAV7QA05_PLEWA|nr:hypothetical protein NDU88_002476 [Pleurodeles waltl]